MAYLIHTPTGGGLMGDFERLVLDTLLAKLPEDFGVAPSFQLKQKGHEALEYDFTVLAPHAVFVVEAKEWYGRITGDDSEWLLNHRPRKCPLWLVNFKCKVLKTELGALGHHVYIAPALVIPDGTENLTGGSWGSHTRSLTGLIKYLQDPSNVTRAMDVARYHKEIIAVLQGKWGSRKRGARRRIGGYEITEVLYTDARTGEYLAKQALIDDPLRYRIRTWRLDGALPADAQERQKAFIKRPTEAVARIGPHPNLLRVLQFEFVDEDSEFFEVTEWSEFGTLHGYLANTERGGLTLRERLEIAEGVASALQAVHARDVVHRNVCPETIQMGFDRRPRLTDFDRAYMESKVTVFADATARHVNEAYVPPELTDTTDYDFDATSDMYSFGVLLFQLLTDGLPFANAKDAKSRQGRPAALPSEKREGVDPRLDALILELLRVDDFKARPSASDALLVLRDVLGTTSAGPRSGPPPSPPRPQPESFEVGNILRGNMRIDDVLGTGGFSKVLKVFHMDHQKDYALKVLLDASNADLLLHEFNAIRPLLPRSHRHIATIEWMERLDPPDRLPCLITEYINGETLEAYCDGRKRLTWTDIRRIGLELLGALVAIHPSEDEYRRLKSIAEQGELDEEQYDALMLAQERAQRGVFHRDLKPANIMLAMPDHRAVLIDFNISALASDRESTGRTPAYCAPDWLTCSRASYDLFSLGCVLYQLITQRHPYPTGVPGQGVPYDPRDIAPELRLSDDLACFLRKAVEPSGADRFHSAREMLEAFQAIDAMYAPAGPRSVAPGRFPGITVSPEEAAKPNYNPYVTRLLTLYSQARRSNAGTRGLDEIARLTYVHTSLDRKLAPAIASGNYRLVIVTGNAGDGKTAFLEQVEALFRQQGAAVERLGSTNGSQWEFEGLRYETNYDGSQDEGDRSNDDVLAAFLAPFEGSTLKPALQGCEARLIAINEGRLLDFLAHSTHAVRFDALRSFVHEVFSGKAQPSGALLVNLNDRAITAGGEGSLVEKQLAAILSEGLWQPCETCAHAVKCPLKYNADTLRDATSGTAVRERVRRLFEVVHLRRRAHVTMRDLRSALSYLLFRDHGCDDVAQLLGRTDEAVTQELADLYYPNAFGDPDALDHVEDQPGVRGEHEERAVDRLVRRLREADVGRVSSPMLDRRLDHDPRTAVPWITFEGRSREPWQVMHALTTSTPLPGDDVPFETLLAQRRSLQAMWRRWAYFERRDDGWKDMLPYRSIPLLEAIVSPTSEADGAKAREKLRDKVLDAISLSEGVRNKHVRHKYLALKITRVKDSRLRSYRLFPKDTFRVEVATPPAGVLEYLEYEPDAVEVVATRSKGGASLRVSLDLLEMLELIGSGYRPTPADLQGLFVNLLIFRNELLTTTFDEVLVTTDDEEFYRIAARGEPDGIRLSLTKDVTLASIQAPGGTT